VSYAPEESSLRKFKDTAPVYPLGVKGEGLLQYLKQLNSNEDKKVILDTIRENLTLFDWYGEFNILNNLMTNEFSLEIRDKYLDSTLDFFDQRSVNKGFLFLLFYTSLFTSKETPSFFGIDNIDDSLSPKLCVKLMQNLSSLAKKHQKQVILTTHNPAILDGLNLEDESQRLFVVKRNEDGFTKTKRIKYKPERQKQLSEIWTKGYIGGLPENF